MNVSLRVEILYFGSSNATSASETFLTDNVFKRRHWDLPSKRMSQKNEIFARHLHDWCRGEKGSLNDEGWNAAEGFKESFSVGFEGTFLFVVNICMRRRCCVLLLRAPVTTPLFSNWINSNDLKLGSKLSSNHTWCPVTTRPLSQGRIRPWGWGALSRWWCWMWWKNAAYWFSGLGFPAGYHIRSGWNRSRTLGPGSSPSWRDRGRNDGEIAPAPSLVDELAGGSKSLALWKRRSLLDFSRRKVAFFIMCVAKGIRHQAQWIRRNQCCYKQYKA